MSENASCMVDGYAVSLVSIFMFQSVAVVVCACFEKMSFTRLISIIGSPFRMVLTTKIADRFFGFSSAAPKNDDGAAASNK